MPGKISEQIIKSPLALSDYVEVSQDIGGTPSTRRGSLLDIINLDHPNTGTKRPVRVATTTAGTLASSFKNSDTIDGIVLVTGDRILIKNQAAGAENGIYTVNASGTPTRAIDFDNTGEVLGGQFIPIQEGTANGGKAFKVTNIGVVTIGTTSITFAEFVGSNDNLGNHTATQALNLAAFNLLLEADSLIRRNADDDHQIEIGGQIALRLVEIGSLVDIICGVLAVLSTTAIHGFLYMPGGNGPPTGVPVTYTGKFAQYFDYANNVLYIYNYTNTSWRSVAM